ncbi:PREDICTED: pentatricopeptide repeat-containing protein At2g28050 [Camelina sativa]|uniref:Pentatricopeptide repeat-containing protein At2g28050 n=1 Tax=Camelina sativa TaxID=90675 RepID=A0ABM0Z5H7_CAMSA|nr:PREDICTED: pentatricopeptide repeat-containing protein At2g28050 [Camelina sativa]
MTLQSFLKTLKTAKRTYPFSINKLLLDSSSINQTLDSPEKPLSDLNLSTFRRILSDPDVKSWKCVSLFNFILESPSLFSFQPDLRAHLSLAFRVLSERRFSDAQKLMKPVAIDDILRYPFITIVSAFVDECGCCETRVVARFFNSMVMVYSDNDKFDEVVEVFKYMKNSEVKIDEKTCTLHLLNLKKSDQMELAVDFFPLMVESGLDVVSVYSLTVVVSALCCNGEITRARGLVEEMVLVKGIKPNIVTFKSMIDCCVKRWDFEELDLVLKSMEKESVMLDLDTYKILIDGFTSYGKLEEAERLVSTMHDEKLRVETYLYNLIMDGYSRFGLVEKAFELHREMSCRGVTPNKDTYWVLMNGLCKAGKVCEAMRLLNELRVNEFEIDEEMYITLTEGCYRAGMIDKSLEVVAEMIREGFIPDGTVFERLADALLEVSWKEAQMMVTFVVKSGIKPKSCSEFGPK